MTHDTTSQQRRQEFIETLEKTLGLLYGLTKIVTDDVRLATVRVLLMTCCNTTLAIVRLAISGYFDNECFVLGRSLFERLINAGFLLSCSTEELGRFNDFAHFKGIAKSNRTVASSGRSVSIELIDPKDMVQIMESELWKRFTGKNGKEHTTWIDKTIERRIEEFSNAEGIQPDQLLLSKLVVYEDASEAIHGSLYGALFQTSTFAARKPSSEAEAILLADKNMIVLLTTLGTTLLIAMRAYARRTGHEELIQTAQSIETERMAKFQVLFSR